MMLMLLGRFHVLRVETIHIECWKSHVAKQLRMRFIFRQRSIRAHLTYLA